MCGLVGKVEAGAGGGKMQRREKVGIRTGPQWLPGQAGNKWVKQLKMVSVPV